jgi:hypothetical protein
MLAFFKRYSSFRLYPPTLRPTMRDIENEGFNPQLTKNRLNVTPAMLRSSVSGPSEDR